jgi:hypothetical protein
VYQAKAKEEGSAMGMRYLTVDEIP